MITRLKDYFEAIRNAIKERAEQENELTGYDMELEQGAISTGNSTIYLMSKKLYYEDYTVEIRNQGDYAYELIITPKKADISPLIYKISHIMGDYGLYGKLLTWERIQSFIESDETISLIEDWLNEDLVSIKEK